MTAPELLAAVESRGGSVAVARDATGAARLKITPRGLVPDLIGDLQKFKPQLIELLDADTQIVASRAATPPANIDVVEYVRARSAGYWARQRIHAEIARRMNQADFGELARSLLRLDGGQEIE